MSKPKLAHEWRVGDYGFRVYAEGRLKMQISPNHEWSGVEIAPGHLLRELARLAERVRELEAERDHEKRRSEEAVAWAKSYYTDCPECTHSEVSHSSAGCKVPRCRCPRVPPFAISSPPEPPKEGA